MTQLDVSKILTTDTVSASDFSRIRPLITSEAVTKTTGDGGAGVHLGQFAVTGGRQLLAAWRGRG
jgi:hypothetical protein